MESIQGDIDEDYTEPGAEFDARTRREFLDERIGNLKLILSNAELIDEDPDPRTVNPGDRVPYGMPQRNKNSNTIWSAVRKCNRV